MSSDNREHHIGTEYIQASSDEVLARLHTSSDGLSKQDVTERHKRYGLNTIEASETSWWTILLRQFSSSFIYLLLASAIISFFLGEIIDGIFILLFILINTALGFYQEFRSHKSLELLRTYVVHKAKVRRQGKEEWVDASLLVPGDIVVVEVGDRLPADLRFIKDHGITIDETILTGESVPVEKTSQALPKASGDLYHAQNIGFAGTTVVNGWGEGVVIATGKQSMLGDITTMTVEEIRESSFEQGIKRFSRFILRLVGITLILVFLINIGIKRSFAGIPDLLVFSIALAISVIPEALPVVTTFALSRGAVKLAKNKVVVKRLSAIEDLGSIEVLCSDKTGTLTENKLTIVDILAEDADTALAYAIVGEPFDTKGASNSFNQAIVGRLSKGTKDTLKRVPKHDEIPFDPVRRRSSVLVEYDGGIQMVVRGAPEHVITTTHASVFQERDAWIQRHSEQGHRLFAVARKTVPSSSQYTAADEESGLTLVALIAFADPVKKTAQNTITQAKKLGVQVKIVTGDSPGVAGAVGKTIGLVPHATDVLTGIQFEALSEHDKRNAVEKYNVFARVSPQQKRSIIELLQTKFQVGFLGEGINDAPALKIAHVGMVVPSAADVARDAADIVLLQRDLHVVINGIQEGRAIFANTLKYIRATLASNFGNFYAVAIASLLIDFLPMLPIQILLVNLLSDFPMIAIATDSVDKTELVRPKKYNIKDTALVATWLGFVSSIFDFTVFALFYKQGPAILQTNWFIASIVTELLFLFSIRTKNVFFRSTRPSWLLIVLSAAALLVTVVIPFTSIGDTLFHLTRPSGAHMMILATIIVVYFVVTESAKLLFYRFINHSEE